MSLSNSGAVSAPGVKGNETGSHGASVSLWYISPSAACASTAAVSSCTSISCLVTVCGGDVLVINAVLHCRNVSRAVKERVTRDGLDLVDRCAVFRPTVRDRLIVRHDD